MHITAFAASNSRNSINRQLVAHAARVFQSEIVPDARIDLLDINDFEMPIYSIDRELAQGIPQPARDLFAKIGASDALLISFAEHNGGYTAAYKNIFDWMSRIDGKVFQDTPMVIMSTSPGPGGAASVLASANASAGFFGADIRGSLSVPSFNDNFDTGAGKLANADISAGLHEALTGLAEEKWAKEAAA